MLTIHERLRYEETSKRIEFCLWWCRIINHLENRSQLLNIDMNRVYSTEIADAKALYNRLRLMGVN